MNADLEFKGCEVRDFHGTVRKADEKEVTEDAVLQWLEEHVIV
jgi:uncharacterized protein YggL (DUF469 family)